MHFAIQPRINPKSTRTKASSKSHHQGREKSRSKSVTLCIVLQRYKKDFEVKNARNTQFSGYFERLHRYTVTPLGVYQHPAKASSSFAYRTGGVQQPRAGRRKPPVKPRPLPCRHHHHGWSARSPAPLPANARLCRLPPKGRKNEHKFFINKYL